jgi:predicted PurR-regulated permease PerM
MGKGGTIEQVQKTVDEIKDEMGKVEESTQAKPSPREVIVEAEQSSTFWPIPTIAGPLMERIASAGLAIVLVIFMLIERDDLRNRLIRLIGYGRITVTTNALEEAGARISRYLVMHSIINSSYGIAVGVCLFLVGLPYAVLWGFLAAVLRFIPYIGPWVAAIIPSALALAAFEGWVWPIVVAGIFLILELFANMLLEPLLYGGSAGVSQVALLVSVAFWTWVWGPIGLVMATPLTVCLVVLGKYVPHLEYITVLMSDRPVAETNMVFYQRLLAMDRNEAVEIIDDYVKTHDPEQVYDEVMVPALNLARLDRERDNLTDAQEQFIFAETRTIVANLDSQPQGSAHGTAGSGTPAEESTPARPNVRILGCPARDEADEVALMMFQRLLGFTRFEVEVLGDERLASEVVAQAGEQQTGLVCIAAVQPGGLTSTRYLCKRLRTQFSDLKIVVGLWGFTGELEATRKSLLSAGADQVGTSLIESRDQIGNLGQLISGSDNTSAPN